MRNKLILASLIIILALLSAAAYADNYDDARRLMEMDKQVRDYQQCKIDKGWWCTNDNSESTAGGKAFKGIVGIVIIIGGIFLLYEKIKDFFTPKLSASDKVSKEVKDEMVADYIDGKTVEEISHRNSHKYYISPRLVMVILCQEGVYCSGGYDKALSSRGHQKYEKITYESDFQPAQEPMGSCPNCESIIPLASQECKKCKASFEVGSAWKVQPL